jgi:NAD(P)-dependent dehydrogenase (short-subunit alcohol dehydrogenase family)
MKDFAGRIAVVTGGASGIGLGTARAFARAGMSVALLDIRSETLDKAVAEIASLGVRAIGIETDVARRESVEAAAEKIDREFGRVHVVMNNAGVVVRGVPMHETDDATWNWVLGVNLFGVVHGAQVFVPRIRAHGEGGHIVNTASLAGFVVGTRGTGVYTASKFAVVAFSEALAHDIRGFGIGVSILAPAAVNSSIYTNSARHRATLGYPNLYAETPPDIAAGMAPDEVGRHVLAAIREEQFYIFTHPETRAAVAERHAAIMAGYDAAEKAGPA